MTNPLNREYPELQELIYHLCRRIQQDKPLEMDTFEKDLLNWRDQYAQQVAIEAKTEGVHEGIALAEAHTLPVVKAYRDAKYKSELSTAMKSLKSGFEQLHNLADEGVSLNATPVDNLKAQQEEL